MDNNTNKNRYSLFTSTSHSAAFLEIERLSKLYKDAKKKNLTIDLFFSSFGNKYEDQYSVVAYYGDQKEELAFLKENVIK